MIHYFFEDIKEIEAIENNNFLLENLVAKENKKLGKLAYIFCSDDYLLKVNQDYLQHDYYTDVISFDYSKGQKISGDIFISIDRVKDNAHLLNISFEKELSRVLVHGLLHFCGYKDKTPDEILLMREKEDFYINFSRK